MDLWTELAWITALLPVAVLAVMTFAQSTRIPERTEIDGRYTWNLDDLYPSVEGWESEYTDVLQAVQQLADLKGTVSESPDKLLHALQLRDETGVTLERLFAYAMLLKDQDTRQSGPQALFDRASTLGVQYGEATAWIEPELLALPPETLRDWCEQHTGLATYRHAFDDLNRQRHHVLSAREEELLAMGAKAISAPQQAFTFLTNADMKFPTVRDADGAELELSQARYSLYMESPDRTLRRNAFEGLMATYLGYQNTIAATLAGSIHKDLFYARARNYPDALHAALGPDNVPVSVYDNLIATVREHLPTLHRYFDVRRRRLGLDKLHLYDMFVPLTEGEAPKINYDDAVRTIVDGLAPLGADYLEPLRESFEGRWIDVYETVGKRSGAYNLGTYSRHPYVLLNYNDTYHQMFTIAHEMGHALHSVFTQKNQPPVYGDTPIFLAEVASTTNEIILGNSLRSRAGDRAEKLFLINLAIENIRGTVITQTLFAEFEKLTHAQAEAGGALTYETLSAIYRNLVTDYYGDAYQHDDPVDGYWLRIPHFYRGFYVYKYATSFCAAAALARRILEGSPGAVDRYLDFLKSGCSDYPIDILKRAGVDMSTPSPIADTMALLGTLVDELDVLV
ncbi:MAG: oligoendopeptidase F [Phycisphaerae bacterium]